MTCSATLWAPSSLDLTISDLARTWKPDGNYTTAQMRDLMTWVMSTLAKCSNAIASAVAAGMPKDLRDTMGNFQGRIQTKMLASLDYSGALNTAEANGVKIINAPGFKDWVIKSLVVSSAGASAAQYAICIKPAVVAFLQSFQQYFNGTIAYAKALGRIAIAAGEAVLKIPDAAAAVVRYSMYAGVAVAAFYLFKRKKRPNPQQRRRR